MDTRAINHILTHSMDFQKPGKGRRGSGRSVRFLGNGESFDHRLVYNLDTHASQVFWPRKVTTSNIRSWNSPDILSIFTR